MTTPLPGAAFPNPEPARPPPTAEWLTVVGGLAIAGVGILLAVSYAAVSSVPAFFPATWGIVLGILGAVCGFGIVACVVLIRRRPARHLIGGAMIILLVIVSVVVASGGLILGAILAFIGGLWLFAWTPSVEAARAGPGAAGPAP